jgi:hypothetical protein
MKTAGKLLSTTFMVAVATLTGASGGSGEAQAQGAEAFGPVASRTFHWKPGTAIEKAERDCKNNSDWLFVRGPNVANAKSIDVSPRTSNWSKQSLPTTDCVAPDCVQLFVRVTDRDDVGARTVTLKHADGRTVTTTFDVTTNAGRCDYPKGK